MKQYLEFLDTAARTTSFAADERRALERINRKVAARESLEAIIEFLFDSTQSISPCDRISLALLEEDGRRVAAHYVCAQYKPLLLKKGYTEDLGGSSLQRVLERRTPRIINDLRQYGNLRPNSASTRLLLREGVRSSMTCPLMLEGRVVGFLFRSSRCPHAYDHHQILLHQAVAKRLGQAVERTCRIEQLAATNRAYLEMLRSASERL